MAKIIEYFSKWKPKFKSGSFIGHQVFDFYMQLPGFFLLIPYKWNTLKRCFQLHTHRWRRLVAYTMALQLYIFISWDFYQFFFAKPYENSPVFPNTTNRILHLNFLAEGAVAFYALSSFLFIPEFVWFLNFMIKFDVNCGGKSIFEL